MRLLAHALAAVLMAVAGPAGTAIVPQPGPGDPHIQSVEYDAQQVVVLLVSLNHAVTLEFSPDERIENVSVGDSAVWQVATDKGAERLFVKPMQAGTDTNMTVITDTRVYAFQLRSSPSADPSSPFIVRFRYPAAPQSPAPAVSEVATYQFAGARRLWPLTITDDGQSTTLIWPERSVIPAVSLIGPDGAEQLANGAFRDGRFVVDTITRGFIFRAHGMTATATRRLKRAR